MKKKLVFSSNSCKDFFWGVVAQKNTRNKEAERWGGGTRKFCQWCCLNNKGISVKITVI